MYFIVVEADFQVSFPDFPPPSGLLRLRRGDRLLSGPVLPGRRAAAAREFLHISCKNKERIQIFDSHMTEGHLPHAGVTTVSDESQYLYCTEGVFTALDAVILHNLVSTSPSGGQTPSVQICDFLI